MKSKFPLKKGFTLIEIIISIIIAAMIGAYVLTGKQKSDFTSAVSNFANNLVSMIESGVIDSTVGYANGSGGDCSSSNDYTDISAGRVKDCVGWKYSIGGTKNTTGTDSYFEGANFLRAYTNNGEGCKVYFDEDGSDPQTFYMFVDCSNLDYDGGSPRYKKYVEDRVDFVLQSKLSTVYQNTKREATAIDNDSGGSADDGMLRIEFKK